MILIGVGSNRGEPVTFARSGIQRIRAFAAGSFRSSSLWLTSPVDCPPDADDFVNAAVAFEAADDLTPLVLLDELKAIEREFGRDPNPVRNAPRELDLDLLLFDAITCSTERLTLPHPRAASRRFVLAPAAEIVPALEWPGTGQTVAQLLAALDNGDRAERMPASC